MSRYGYRISYNNETISESNLEFDSYSEAESEGNFAASSLADNNGLGLDWYDFTVEVFDE